MRSQPRTQEELLTWVVEQIKLLNRQRRTKREPSTEGQRIVFTPEIENGVTLGNGSVTGSYVKTGKRVTVSITLQLGSTSAVTSDIRFQSPVGAASGVQLSGNARVRMAGTIYDGFTLVANSLYVRFRRVSGSSVTQVAASPTVPATWGAGTVSASFDYLLS